MSRGVDNDSAKDAGEDEASYSRRCLGSLARILVRAGHSPEHLAKKFAAICEQLQPSQEAWDDGYLPFMADLGHVMTYWHSDPDYIDAAGRPLSLPLDGPGRSLLALIRRALPDRDTMRVATSLRELHGVKQEEDSRLSPAGRYLTFHDNVDSGAHGLMALLGMLQTVERNMFQRAGETRLIERTAVNPRIPVTELPKFYRRLEEATRVFLLSVDDDMRRREAAEPSAETRRAGVGVFAFEEPSPASGSVTKSRHGNERRDPTGEDERLDDD